MDQYLHEIADTVLEMEVELRRLGLWEESPPPDKALNSLQPFCCDTLLFYQCLQWVFVPKMKQILETEEDFPASSDIYPLAEQVFREMTVDTRQLLALIKRFDRLITEGKPQLGKEEQLPG